jgi:hypothetical protein
VKSLATVLHGDAVTDSRPDVERVQFRPYEGVAPGRYLETFTMECDSRKDTVGNAIRREKSTVVPRASRSQESFPALEGLVVNRLRKRGLIGQNGSRNVVSAK